MRVGRVVEPPLDELALSFAAALLLAVVRNAVGLVGIHTLQPEANPTLDVEPEIDDDILGVTVDDLDAARLVLVHRY